MLPFLGGKKKIHSDCKNEFNDEEEPDLLEIIEIVAKDTQFRQKELQALVGIVIDTIPTVKELKQEIAELKKELKEQIKFNQDLIIKFVEKPVAPSAAQLYAANKAAEADRSKSGFAAVDSAAKK